MRRVVCFPFLFLYLSLLWIGTGLGVSPAFAQPSQVPSEANDSYQDDAAEEDPEEDREDDHEKGSTAAQADKKESTTPLQEVLVHIEGFKTYDQYWSVRKEIRKSVPRKTDVYEKIVKRGQVTLALDTELKGVELKKLLHGTQLGDKRIRVSRVRADSIRVELK